MVRGIYVVGPDGAHGGDDAAGRSPAPLGGRHGRCYPRAGKGNSTRDDPGRMRTLFTMLLRTARHAIVYRYRHTCPVPDHTATARAAKWA